MKHLLRNRLLGVAFAVAALVSSGGCDRTLNETGSTADGKKAMRAPQEANTLPALQARLAQLRNAESKANSKSKRVSKAKRTARR